ncbi:MAG: Ig-like domain repeat protein [Pseudomonadota bacterium]
MRPSAPWFPCFASLALAMLPTAPAAAQCVPFPVPSDGTTQCSGNVGNIDTRPSTNVGVSLLPGANAGVIQLISGRVDVGTTGGAATVAEIYTHALAGIDTTQVIVENRGSISGQVSPDPSLGNRWRSLLVSNYGQMAGPVWARLINFPGGVVDRNRGEFLNSGTIRRADLCSTYTDFTGENQADGVIEDYLLTNPVIAVGVTFGDTSCQPYRITNRGRINGGAGLVGVVAAGVGDVPRGLQVMTDLDLTNTASGVIAGPVVMSTGRRGRAGGVVPAPAGRNAGLIQGGVLLYGSYMPSPVGDLGDEALFQNQAGGRIGGAIVVNAGRFEQAADAVFLAGASLHPSGMFRTPPPLPDEEAGTIAVAGTHTVTCVGNDPWPQGFTQAELGVLELAGGATLTVSPASNCTYVGRITGPGTLRKTGTGAYIFSGTATHGSTVVQQGLWFANGDQGAMTIENSGIVIGIGRMGDTLVRNGGRLAPGGTPGTLASGSLTMQSPSVFEFEASATTSDRLDVTGTVSLGGATLDALLVAGYTHQPGRAMTLIANDGADAVTGTFTGRAEGAEFTLGGFPFRIRYAAGDGNDVVLFALNPAAAVTLAPVSGTPNEGTPVTLTATATGTAPTGVVTFRDGGAPIAGCVDRPLAVNGNSATASCTTSALAGGPRSLTAVYAGDNANPTRTSAAVAVTINGRPSLSAPASLSVLEDSTAAPLAITVGDAESGAAGVALSATSGDAALVTDAALAAGLGGSGASRTLAITPRADAFGGTTITLAASDPAGAVRTAPLALTVTPVNDPPTFALGGNPAHAAGTTGAQSRPGFVSQVSAGPGEAAQAVLLAVSELEDAGNVVSDAALAPNGSLTYTLTGASGVARLQVAAEDNGGTADGGRDRTQREFRIVVGNGADLQVGLARVLPDPGPGRRAYRITARNNGPADLAGVTVRGLVAGGLLDLSWTCTGACAAVSGVGAPTLVGDLAAGAVAEIVLQGSVDATVPFVSLEATIAAPNGVSVLNPTDDRATLVEANGIDGLLRDGFEPLLQRAQ